MQITGDPKQWVRSVSTPVKPKTFTCDVLIVGAGSGGVTSRITRQLGLLDREIEEAVGQFSSALSLDKNCFIEFSAGTRT